MVTTAMAPKPTNWPPQHRDNDAEAAELRKIRKAFGWSQETASRFLGVSQKTYNSWETNRSQCQWAALELMRCWLTGEAPRKK
jgi:DNA-binding transcriptional regulator YiaG